MNLDKIQEMWERDAVIDPDNLHDESLKIPQLHAKYYTIYNTITLLREKAREQYSKVKLERHNYYTALLLFLAKVLSYYRSYNILSEVEVFLVTHHVGYQDQ